MQEQFLHNEERIIKRLREVYGQSLKDINEKIKDLEFSIDGLTEQYDWMDDADPKKATVKSKIQSKIYQKQYQEQLQKQVDGILNQMNLKQYLSVADYLDECYTDGFIGTVFDMHGQGVPLLMPLDQEAMVRAVQTDSKIRNGLYTHLGENVTQLKRHITAQVSRGISTGMSYSQVAKQLSLKMMGTYKNPGGSMAYATRIARTEGHRIQCTAAMDACHMAKDRGADVVKQWDAALDARTRESHTVVDGEIRELDEAFSNGLQYPGDPAGGAAEVVNCRCALLQRARWALDESELKTLQERAAFFGLDKSENFSDYKSKYISAVESDAEPDNKYGFKAIQGAHSIDFDLQVSNPNFNKGREYQVNCQRCVPTYEMRRRGYDVEALPRIMKGRDDVANKWQRIFEGAQWDSTVATNRSAKVKQNIIDKMTQYGDGARAEIYCVWKGGSSAHVFAVENSGGVVRFIDPQTGNTDCSDYFEYLMPTKTEMCRLDNLAPTDWITGCCENKR